jgi:hypothetical protein
MEVYYYYFKRKKGEKLTIFTKNLHNRLFYLVLTFYLLTLNLNTKTDQNLNPLADKLVNIKFVG